MNSNSAFFLVGTTISKGENFFLVRRNKKKKKNLTKQWKSKKAIQVQYKGLVERRTSLTHSGWQSPDIWGNAHKKRHTRGCPSSGDDGVRWGWGHCWSTKTEKGRPRMALKLLRRQFNLKFIMSFIKIILEHQAIQFKNSYLVTFPIFKQIHIAFIS